MVLLRTVENSQNYLFKEKRSLKGLFRNKYDSKHILERIFSEIGDDDKGVKFKFNRGFMLELSE